jgi:RNA polymerase sigma-70 factor, ECF subfamily
LELCNGEDRDLVEGIIKKDEAAFEMLINIYGNRLLKVCYLILKETPLAEDAVQEVFIQIYKSIYSFNYKASLYTWIYKIAINKCRDILKRNGDFNLTLEPELIIADTDLEQETLEQLKRDNIRELVAKLPSIHREIVILFYFEDLSVKEIAVILDEKENTVKSRLLRARSMLKEVFIREGIADEG